MTNVHQLFPTPGPDPAPDTLIAEDQVLRYRPALAKSLLLAARKAKKITFTTGARGTVWYRLPDVDAFLKTRETQCLGHAPDPSLKLTDTGSRKSQAGTGSTISGMTRELAEHVAEASAQEILGKPKSA